MEINKNRIDELAEEAGLTSFVEYGGEKRWDTTDAELRKFIDLIVDEVTKGSHGCNNMHSM